MSTTRSDSLRLRDFQKALQKARLQGSFMKRSRLRDTHNRLETETVRPAKFDDNFKRFLKDHNGSSIRSRALILTQKAELARVDDAMIANRLILLFFIFKSSSESLEELETITCSLCSRTFLVLSRYPSCFYNSLDTLKYVFYFLFKT